MLQFQKIFSPFIALYQTRFNRLNLVIFLLPVALIFYMLLHNIALGQQDNITPSPPSHKTQENKSFNIYFKALLAEQNNDFNRSAELLQSLSNSNKLPPIKNLILLHALIMSGQFDAATALSHKIYDHDDYRAVFARILLVLKALREQNPKDAEKLINHQSWNNSHDVLRILAQIWTYAAIVKEGIKKDDILENLDILSGDATLRYLVPYLKASVQFYTNQSAQAYQTLYDSVQGEWLRLGTVEMELFLRILVETKKQDELLKILTSYIELGKANAALLRDYRDYTDHQTLENIIQTPAQGLANAISVLGIVIYQDLPDIRLQLLRLSQRDIPYQDSLVLHIANTLADLNQFEQSNKTLSSITETSLLSLPARILEADNYYHMGDSKTAKNLLLQLKNQHPGERSILLKLSLILRVTKKYDAMIELFDDAIKKLGQPLPRDWKLYYDRGIAWHMKGNWTKAEQDFKQALKLDPTNPSILNYLGYSWVDMGIHIERAFAMIKKAVSLSQNDGAIIDSLGWAYFKQKKYKEAVKYLERAIQLLPDDPVINDHLGDAYWKVGRRYEAQFQWKRALKLEPDPELKEKINHKFEKGI
ncbi:MAG: tetratricopeptide repeat protein [Pseudomonadota bacterium]